MRSNIYSPAWFATFLAPIPREQTRAEVDFLARQLPLPAFRQILDLCCGPGRHALPLAERGYEVTGLDFNEEALREAGKKAGTLRVNFVLGDLRNETLAPASYHAILVLWQSFGFFTPMENRRLLEKWHAGLKPGGRLVLDVYNRDFFAGKDGIRVAQTPQGPVTETKKLRGSQLSVKLEYPGGASDAFQWELYTLAELTRLLEETGFRLVLACTEFNELRPVAPSEARMQLVGERG